MGKFEKREIIVSESRGFEGVWIPKKLYMTNKFNLRTKFFVVEIKSLSKNGYCFATDKHFAKFLGVSERMVQTMIKQLKEDGYLTAKYEYEKDTKAIKRRFLILTQKFFDEFYNEEEHKPTEINFDTRIEENFDTPTEVNFNTGTEKNFGEKYNNNIIYNNNTSDTKSSIPFKKASANAEVYNKALQKRNVTKLIPYEYTQEELCEFIKQKVIQIMGKVCPDAKTNEVSVVSEVISYFYEQYRKFIGERHPILSDLSYTKIVLKMLEPIDPIHQADFILDKEAYMAMIDRFFLTDYGVRLGGTTDYRIGFFFSDQVMENLFYRELH